eukprot:NODE_325_length_10950_cov_0.271864.p3 type:complete len:588 gc:universal NODE_325_length_10950_cov_0.271864:423-2186(+)
MEINHLQNWKEHLKSLEDNNEIENWLLENPLRIPFHLFSQLLKWNLKKYITKPVLSKLIEYPPLLKTCLFHGIDPNLLENVATDDFITKMVNFFKELHLHLHDSDSNNKTLVVRLAERGTEKDCLFLRSLIERMDIDDSLLINADEDGFVPLHTAVLKQNVNMVREFVRYSVDLNTPDSNGSTALHLACLLGNREIVDLLVDAKADMFIKDYEGNTPADIATENCRSAVSSDPYEKWYGKKSGMSREERKLLMYEKRFAEMNGSQIDEDGGDDTEEETVPAESEKQQLKGGYRKKKAGRRISVSSIEVSKATRKIKSDYPHSAPSQAEEVELKRKRSRDEPQTEVTLKRIKLDDPADKITQVFTTSSDANPSTHNSPKKEMIPISTQTVGFIKNSYTQTFLDSGDIATQCDFGGKIPESSIYPIFTFNLPMNNSMLLTSRQAKSVFEIFAIKYDNALFTKFVSSELELLQSHLQLQQLAANESMYMSVVAFKDMIAGQVGVAEQLLFIPCDLKIVESEIEDNTVKMPLDMSPFELIKNARANIRTGKEAIKKLLGVTQPEDLKSYKQVSKMPSRLAFKLLFTKTKLQ